MNFIYGPVTSRRLGRSLGVVTTPYKYCSLNCVYCQLGKTTKCTYDRKEYVKPKAILSELSQFLKENPHRDALDYVTLSGSGEPLLNSKIKEIIDGIKELTQTKVALITNATLLVDKAVRNDILGVDLIVPSLDAFTQDVFEKIDRPSCAGIHIDDIINGLIALRKEFSGQVWLEIMIVKDINDDIEYLRKFNEVIERINPNKIQLNVISRPPAETWVKSPSLDKLKTIQVLFGPRCELVLSE